MTRAVTQHRVSALAMGSDRSPAYARPTHLGVLAVAARQPIPGRRDAWSRIRLWRRARSATPRLTAKVTAKPHDNRGPQHTILDGYRRPELRRCGRRGLAEQLTSPTVEGIR
jgi:hypothetical protein